MRSDVSNTITLGIRHMNAKSIWIPLDKIEMNSLTQCANENTQIWKKKLNQQMEENNIVVDK